MEYLDPRYEKKALRKLFVGYGLVALVIGMAGLILLYWSYGYGLNKKGDVTQNGLVFVSSQPTGGSVYLNGAVNPAKTNARFVLPSKDYDVRISKAGYNDWSHQVTVRGGDVQRFDYPLLVPKKLTASPLATYDAPVSLLTQTPNRRWILVMTANKPGQFIQYDLRDPAKPAASTLSLATDVFTDRDGSTTQTWKALEWSDDNRFLLLEHTFAAAGEEPAGQEYLLLDRRTPENSTNLTRALSLPATEKLSLFNKQSTMFYGYNQETKVLRTIPLNASDAKPLVTLNRVYGYKTYSDDTVLYVTDTPPSGKRLENTLSVVLQQGPRSTVLRRLPAAARQFVLDIAQYDHDWYVIVSAETEAGAHIYKNPQTQVLTKTDQLPVPWRFLRLANPVYGGFSANARFVLVQNKQAVVVYDAELIATYSYMLPQAPESPQEHAAWMDGHRLLYVANGTAHIADYDNTNRHALLPSQAAYMPVFSPDYHYLYTLGSTNEKAGLVSTPLVIP